MNGSHEKGNSNDPALDSAKDTLDILGEMSTILKTGLDAESLAISYRLVDNGINPQTLAEVVSKLRTEGVSTKNANGSKF